MDDIQQALAAAWQRIRPMLERDPAELARRLARRRSALIERPQRAWCLAVRATDRRLDAFCLSYPDKSDQHEVRLDSRALRKLCAPVFIPSPGLPLADLSRILGISPHGLLDARLAGVFETHHIPSRFGKPHPMLYSGKGLDPSARGFAWSDPIWSVTARDTPGRIPKNIKQTLTRVPLYQPIGPSYRDTAGLHPEHPALDPVPSKRSASRGRQLPPPAPDFVWYKWKGDQYIGYDWRAAETNPLIRIHYERHQNRLARERERRKKRREEQGPPPSKSRGSLQFRGWRWLCPTCGKKVNLLYYPLQRRHLLPLPCRERAGVRVEAREFDKALLRADAKSRHLAPRPRFACRQCHRVRQFSHCNYKGWNELVTYLSAGLLYGHEVQRPAWCAPKRKIAYAPRPTRQPSRRRLQIERALIAGQTCKEIGLALSLSKSTVLWYAQQIYRVHGVACLKELLIKHGRQPRPHMRGPALGKRGQGRQYHYRRPRKQPTAAYQA